ncbi:hypothetical protein EK21DRAFT_99335 [Setomelanomma holmii]|uniref:Uncharacterized protein n=1 Tax=Setomelanomma holmii TaxID=210430 RepID=A0A9P4HEB7_9PLEO|nr:hypothetical protein EK21DRAFT_99335 [Setomelanomma holmii]
MTTAPPTTRMPLFTSGPCLPLASSSFISPASTPAFELDFDWASMPPHEETNVTPADREPPSNGGLIFITGDKPADFKSKKVMTVVRKKAMDAYLKGDGKEKNVKSSAGRSRFSSVDSASRASNRSRSSVGREDALTDISTTGRLPYDEYQPRPFVSIGKSLDPFRTMFQASHPSVSVEEMKFYCSRYFGTKALGRYWIPTALSHPHTFLGTLCLATAYHDVIHERQLESVQTIALRQEVIHLVGRNMTDTNKRVSDHNIMAIIQLIISEVIGREESGLTWHETGMETMIEQRGGLNQLAPTANKSTTLLQDLRTAIECSNYTVDVWADMAGVLLWIGLVVGAASKNSDSKILKKYFSALTMRTGVMLCFEHPEAINATMLRMTEVVETLGGNVSVKSWSGEENSSNGKGKKRRV